MDEQEILHILDAICDGKCEYALSKLDGYIMRSNLTISEELIIQNLQIIAESVIIYKDISAAYQEIKLATQKGSSPRNIRMNLN